MKLLKIDKSIYAVNDAKREYCFYKRNKKWIKLSKEKNNQNKKRINQYRRLLKNGRKKIYRYRQNQGTKATR